jgi:DNA polymerase I-like protein with 3'-5' exonuclease and polymerase domains
MSKLLTLGLSSMEDDEDVDDPMANMGVKQQKDVDFDGLVKPWMKYHKFVVVQSMSELNGIVDAAFKTGKCALDLETQGLDSRIYLHKPGEVDNIERWWEDGQAPELVPQTVHKIVGYCLSVDGQTGYYVPVRHLAKEGTKNQADNLDVVAVGRAISRLCLAAQPVLEDEGFAEDPLGSAKIKTHGQVKIFFWNAKFDQEFLFPVTGLDFWHPDSFEDGMLMYFTRYTSDKSLSLKKKSKDELCIRDPKGGIVLENNDKIPYLMIELKELFPKGRPIDFTSLDPYEARHYACSDAICTFLHCDKKDLQDILTNKKYCLTYRLEKQVSQVVRVMERARIRVDVEYVRKLLGDAQTEALGYRAQIVDLAAQYGFKNFDPQSPKQLSEFLFSSPNGLKIEPKPEMNEKSGQYKTDADTLEGLVEHNTNINPVLLTVVKYRQVEKVIGTYLESMVANVDQYGDLRYQWRQTGAATGRFSSPSGADMPGHGFGGVPMHGIPSTYDEKKPLVARCLRQAFVARPGYFMVKVDYAGEELRIVTNLSGEPVWTKEFLHGSGDLHTITARAFFNKAEVSKQERQSGKMANFSLVYGGGTGAIMRATGCDKIEAGRRKQNFDKAVPTFAKWVSNQKRRVKLDKGVMTAFGRWIAIPEIDHENPAIAAGAERQSINYPIQGSGADIMKIAMIRLHKEFYKRGWFQTDVVHMMLTVHDEIVFEVKGEYLMDVMPVIDSIMTMPSRMLNWKVPLVAEPLIDKTWDAKYDFHKMVHGEPYNVGDKVGKGMVVLGGRIYQKVPDFLEPFITPEWKQAGHSAPAQPETNDAPTPPATPVSIDVELPDDIEGELSLAAEESRPSPSQPPKASSVPESHFTVADEPTYPKVNNDVYVYPIRLLTYQSAKQVYTSLVMHHKQDGRPIRVIFTDTGETLVSEDQGFRVDVDLFKLDVGKLNL